MKIWSAEIRELEKLHNIIRDQYPILDKELSRLIKSDDENMVLVYARRCLEIIISDLCENELKRPRGSEPLKRIIDRLNREEKVPSHIIGSMNNINSISTFGAHPKEFDPEQVKPVLLDLSITLRWYMNHSGGDSRDIIKDEWNAQKKSRKDIPEKDNNSVDSKESYIAVLPFDNFQNDSTQLWFSDGISDVIRSRLINISGLKVVGKPSSLKEWAKEKTTREIGEELGVDYFLRGSTQVFNEKIRIVPELIRTQDEECVWSHVYDDHFNEIFDIQTNIAQEIVANMKIILSRQEQNILRNAGTDNPKALEYYLRGNFHMSQQGADNRWKAIEAYKRAIKLDPGYVQPYLGNAAAYFDLTYWAVEEPDPELIPVVREWAQKTLTLNNDLGEPYYFLGSISYFHEKDWKRAETEFKKGFEKNPDYVWGCMNYAHLLGMMRRFEESLLMYEHCLRLDPVDPWKKFDLAMVYYFVGQSERAINLAKTTLEKHPEYWIPKRMMGIFQVMEGYENNFIIEYCDDYLKSYNHDLKKMPAFFMGDVGYWLILLGRKKEGLQILNELRRRVDEGEKDISFRLMGYIYYALGDTEKALDYLELSYEHREQFNYIINLEPILDPLRSNERYQDLLKKMGLEV